jgi:DAACS family dicarboxylate/amino acid:cation (Na+ or H+) symporter
MAHRLTEPIPPVSVAATVDKGPQSWRIRSQDQNKIEGADMAEAKSGGISLQMQMLIGFLVGLLGGLAVYMTAPGAEWVQILVEYVTRPIGTIFLNLLMMLVIPLLFAALVVGISEMGEIRSLRRVGLKTLGYTVLMSTIAVAVSLVVVNLLQPGAGFDQDTARSMLADTQSAGQQYLAKNGNQPTGVDAIVGIVPKNIVAAMADNAMVLSVMFFALFFGIGLLLSNTPKTQLLQDAFEGLFEVMMKLITIVIRIAPLAVACFMFNLSALFGWELLLRLAAYVGAVLLALGIQLFIVFPLFLRLVAGKNPLTFFRQSEEAMIMAFSTASSNATLPTALRVAEDRLKLPRPVSRFVLTVGATANQNGTAMFEGVTVIFLAQLFSLDLTLTDQLMVMAVCILGGIGTAGVPGGSLPVVALILAMVGVDPAAIGLVLGVDRLLDMCRTTLNVTGDLAIATMVSKGEDALAAEPAPGSEAFIKPSAEA